MIPANQLQIGNWVLVNGKEIEIFSMAPATDGNTYGFNLFEGGMPEFYDYDCEPIPLTPEILKKCGFEKKSPHCWWEINRDFKGENDFDLDTNFIPHINNEYSVGIKIEFLHQLQNKYFSWYGEGLEIKENATL